MIYGNPSLDIFKLSNQQSFLDTLFLPMTETKLPDEKSDVVKKELEEIRLLNEQYLSDEYLQKRYQVIDRSLFQYIKNISFTDDDSTMLRYRDLVLNIFNDVMPLVCKLKLKYQRPRPFQLAALHHVSIYPSLSYSAQCPSYPSTHACMGAVLDNVCSNTFPQTINLFRDITGDMYHSRMYMGLCLPSDVDAGRDLAQKILDHKEFKMKYRL